MKDYIVKLESYADRAWYPPLLALLALLDNFLVFIPSDGILIGSSILVPKRWAIFATAMTIGSALGSLLLLILIEKQGLPWVLDFFPDIQESQIWKWTAQFFSQYGLYLVFAISISPVFQHPAVILSAMANIPHVEIISVIFIGRLIKSLYLAYIGTHSPKFLKKMWGVEGELKDAGVELDDDKNKF